MKMKHELNEILEEFPLPNELTTQLFNELEDRLDQRNFVMSSRFFYYNYRLEWLKKRLAEATVIGNQNTVQKILQHYPEWLIEKRKTLEDKSGRVFFNLSIWEYTLWALDVRYMAPMMLDCIPDGERGNAIHQELAKQLAKVETQGVTYQLNGQSYHERHYDFAILPALANYNLNYSRWNEKSRKEFWCTTIGELQWLLPAHIAQHYCDYENGFNPTPTFKNEKFTRSLRYYNGISGNYENWYSPRSKTEGLGINFAISPVFLYPKEITGAFDMLEDFWVSVDIRALTVLQETRLDDWKLLKERLQGSLLFDCKN
ncbi:hypothetical protein [Legionella clemsonensis]|uniref:Uncharacterized protein n=1 Tax=Legionella clemsonensis TaxID=1867846 RepID=A0A222P2V5_9GAMM|nr:hypothetical protein [Legionella clemsonensis]ASQ46172.1 hypothetical protein clem_08100 [Legionella clemsonensis]